MRRIILFLVVLIFIITCIVFLYLSNIPSNGTLGRATSNDVKELMNKKNTLKDLYNSSNLSNSNQIRGTNRFDGTYFTLLFPNSYQIKSKLKNKGMVLEQLIISEPDVISKTFIITVSQSSAKTYDDLTGVNFRRINKASYTESKIVIDGKEGIVFETLQDGYERSAFFLDHDKSLSIVFTSPSASPLPESFTSLSSHLHWLK